jgi:hypothetical protein
MSVSRHGLGKAFPAACAFVVPLGPSFPRYPQRIAEPPLVFTDEAAFINPLLEAVFSREILLGRVEDGLRRS